MLTEAVALGESGVLVNGMSATDLLSRFRVIGEQPAGPSPDFRGSGVPLSRLEAVRELVAEVLEERAADPELTSANPAVPRTVFPWGIGIGTSDVVVVGPDKEVTAAYLRMVGLRARTVDATEALRIAGDLATARSLLTDGELEEPETESAPEQEPEPHHDVRERRKLKLDGRTLPRPAIAAAVSVLVVGGAAVVVATTVVLPASGTAEELSRSPETSAPAQSAADVPGEHWRDLTSNRGEDEPGVARPEVTVTVDVPGWQVTDSSGQRDIWTSDDPDMRVLTAAVPTPVGTQAELDTAMLAALEDAVGAGDVVVTARSPVDYEEVFPESTTTWRVRLVDGHQVSVGCQYRQESAQRMEVCDRFTSTARVR
ncbi:MAG TPA: type VII secretion-associated protein [Candidatus Corynebacterium avicola]|uniref:Type VII secretion-associated protein n=1 Tax=Candidatus Corynebacterium avicola TaxID=2838527 RepID=A0A9D1UKX5_9CORY|nr:type VII secretion-associated protein [Candidatus Corynebacterium avicola]